MLSRPAKVDVSRRSSVGKFELVEKFCLRFIEKKKKKKKKKFFFKIIWGQVASFFFFFFLSGGPTTKVIQRTYRTIFFSPWVQREFRRVVHLFVFFFSMECDKIFKSQKNVFCFFFFISLALSIQVEHSQFSSQPQKLEFPVWPPN